MNAQIEGKNLCGRYGDYSPNARLLLRKIITQREEAITVTIVIDDDEKSSAPNPRFCGSRDGCSSLQTFQILRSFFLLGNGTDSSREVTFFESDTLQEKGNSLKFFMSSDGDVVVCCRDRYGDALQEEVYFPKEGMHYKKLSLLFAALQCDNATEKTHAVVF